jgi:hypothetical protein
MMKLFRNIVSVPRVEMPFQRLRISGVNVEAAFPF